MLSLTPQLEELGQYREQLELDAAQQWTEFLQMCAPCSEAMRRTIGHLATLDCILSLAAVAKERNYCRPQLSRVHAPRVLLQITQSGSAVRVTLYTM